MKSNGFTIIELLIVVAIVGIIAAIAIGSYEGQTDVTYQSDAQSALLQFSNAMERSYTERTPSTYTGLAQGGNTGKPANFFTQTPIDGGTKMYNLTISAATAAGYTLLATPIVGEKMAGTGRIELNSNGQRCWYSGADSTGGTCTEW